MPLPGWWFSTTGDRALPTAGGGGAEPLGGAGTGIRDREVQGGFHPFQALWRVADVLSGTGAGPTAFVGLPKMMLLILEKKF